MRKKINSMKYLFFLSLICSLNLFASEVLVCSEEGSLRFDLDNIKFGDTKMPLDIKNYKSELKIKIDKDSIVVLGAHEAPSLNYKRINEGIYLRNNTSTNPKNKSFIGYSSLIRISKNKDVVIKTKLDELSSLFSSTEIYKCKK